MSYRETLKEAGNAAGFTLSEKQLDQFTRYADLLLETNKSLNLTAITDPEEVAVKHMVDSLLVYDPERFHNHTIVDVGTGAGFPGLPLKIYDPGMRVTLIDSLQKRLNFLEQGRIRPSGKNSMWRWHGRWRPCRCWRNTACPWSG